MHSPCLSVQPTCYQYNSLEIWLDLFIYLFILCKRYFPAHVIVLLSVSQFWSCHLSFLACILKSTEHDKLTWGSRVCVSPWQTTATVPGHLYSFCIAPTFYLSSSLIALKPKRVHELPCICSIAWSSTVPLLKCLLSEEIVSVFLCLENYKKTVTTTTVKRVVCRLLWK